VMKRQRMTPTPRRRASRQNLGKTLHNGCHFMAAVALLRTGAVKGRCGWEKLWGQASDVLISQVYSRIIRILGA